MFDTPAWFENLQRHGLPRQPAALHALEVYGTTEHEPVGLLHLMRWSDNGPLLGLSNYYSSLFGPAWLDGVPKQADWLELAGRIRRLPGASVIRLQPLDAEGVFIRGLETGLRAHHYSVDRFFCFGNWYVHGEPGGFEAYWARRPAQLRHTVERARRKLGRSHTWHTEILTTPSPALEAGVAAYLDVYAHSWKEPEPNQAFMPMLIRMAAGNGSLRLGLLWLDGVVVAAQVWIVTAGKAHIFKLAYRSQWARLSVGSVLTAALMQHVMDVDGVREVDYLTGDDRYKKDWMSHRRERVGLIAFDTTTWRGCWAWGRHSAGKLYRRWRSSGPGDEL